MMRSHTCGELRSAHCGSEVTLCGWIQTIRDKGSVIWVDLRDRYGITQLVMEEGKTDAAVLSQIRECGREYVICIKGKVIDRFSKNPKIETGDVEVFVTGVEVLNVSKVPPFTIEDESDGGDELRMKYRYLDLRRNPLKNNMILRNNLARETRNYLQDIGFMEIETPYLIKSTPEGARDFVVPSRLSPGQFYALPQSPQTFKQLLMVSGYDKYYQIVRCFRDEDLRADRQPEFTQIDCEMAFVDQEDILNTFEGLMKKLFKATRGIELSDFPRMTWEDAMSNYGSDKPDLRFDMKFNDISALVKGHNFKVFDDAEIILAINATGCAEYTRKQLDELTDFVKRPQV
ncbi:MAG: aspartate--tRNA ligase, partial [Bacteroidetes bacterium HGW-Bacteroidetes-21]